MDLVDHASAVVRARDRDRRRTGEEIDGERLLALPTTRICRRDAGVVPGS